MLTVWGLSLELPDFARFAIVALCIGVAPHIARRIGVPACVGFIAMGALIGPHALGVMPLHAAITDFVADLGKLLLMFFVGLEIDLKQFSAQRRRAVAFGLVTFALPMAAGMAAGFAFGYGTISAVLIGSLLASHTLIAFPLVAQAGLGARPAVAATVGATVLTDMLSLLVLASCLSAHQSGFAIDRLAIEVAELVAFSVFMIVAVGWLGRYAVRRLGDSDDAIFALLLVVVAVAATLAEAIDLEGIIGAFLAGLAVNQAVRGSPARHQLEFVGNAFLIPMFFVVTGFLVDPAVMLRTLRDDLPLVIAIVGGLLASKWAAGEIMGRAWGLPSAERGLIGSLTMPQVAATLASALVGYEAVNAAGERLLDDRMLNTVLVLVVATSVLGPILTARRVRALGGAAPQGRAVPSPAE